MTERLNELKGNIEQEYGKMRNDAQTQATGETEAAEARLRRKLHGALQEAAGAVEEYLGATHDNPLVTADGEARRVAGTAEQAG